MKYYEKVINSMVATSSVRMLIGAISTIYMVSIGINLYEIGLIKSLQAVSLMFFGFFSGFFSDRLNRKYIYLYSIILSSIWLFFMYIGGVYKNVNIFYIAEIINAISLSLFQNNSNGYLIESAKLDHPTKDLNEVFGVLNKKSFFFMAVCSLLGGIIYSNFEKDLFILSSILMILVFILSTLFLPTTRKNKTLHKNILSKNELYILIRKFSKHWKILSIFVIYSLYFQIIIQYWQVLMLPLDVGNGKESWLGITLFLMFIAQSLSGYGIEKKWLEKQEFMLLGSILSLIALLGSLHIKNIYLFITFLCINMFFIRYVITNIGVLVHIDLKDRFRSKYDMVVNFTIRCLTAVFLIFVGYISEHYGVKTILELGILLFIISSFILCLKKQAV